MIELVVGAVIGAFVSLTIAEVYHRRASASMNRTLQEFDKRYNDLLSTVESVWEQVEAVGEKTEAARLAVVRGTAEDPAWPYK